MNWEQKLMALKSLDDIIGLRLREPGDWYVSTRIEISDSHFLSSPTETCCQTPEDAVLARWECFTNLKPDERLVIHATRREAREAFRWNGHMWERVAE